MADFPQNNPPANITNPSLDGTGTAAVVDPKYPAHLHKYAAPSTEKDKNGKLVEHYTSGEYIVVHTDAEKAKALADGWSETPVLTPPTEKEEKADKAKDKAKDK